MKVQVIGPFPDATNLVSELKAGYSWLPAEFSEFDANDPVDCYIVIEDGGVSATSFFAKRCGLDVIVLNKEDRVRDHFSAICKFFYNKKFATGGLVTSSIPGVYGTVKNSFRQL